jgi:hypothetical protein
LDSGRHTESITMKLTAQRAHAALGLALVIFAPACEATAAHRRIHNLFEKKHTHLHVRQPEHDETQSRAADPSLLKRSTCAFPADADPNLVAITPDSTNGGWAMSPDQSCDTDSYCPYACKPGMVMAQWDPDSSFTYPASMVSPHQPIRPDFKLTSLERWLVLQQQW